MTMKANRVTYTMTALPKKHLGYGQNDQAYIFGKKNITLYRMFYRGKIE